MLRKQIEMFINNARSTHRERYIYDKVEFRENKRTVTVVCVKHGDFEVKPSAHILGRGCPDCVRKPKPKLRLVSSGEQAKSAEATKVQGKLTKEEFLLLARERHGDKYQYDKVEIERTRQRVIITCPVHGDFEQMAYAHYKVGSGCQKCGKMKIRGPVKVKPVKLPRTKRGLTTEQAVERFKNVHGSLYDYSKVVYKDSKTAVTIVCKKHGEFQQKPNSHISGKGCYPCGREAAGQKLAIKYGKKKPEGE